VTYRVELSTRAKRDVSGLAPRIRVQILKRLAALTADPRPPGVKRLAGTDQGYRIRVGAYRVLYRIEDDRLLVLVVTVGHRREVVSGALTARCGAHAPHEGRTGKPESPVSRKAAKRD
jgi:mRNA interferase RelE/StbE